MSALLFGACTSRGTISVAGHGNEPMQSPVGCAETMCDYFYARCADPCEDCWESCGREDDQLSVIKCTQRCNTLCDPSTKVAPLEQCAAELADCRATTRNTVCIDHLRNDMPRGMPVCSPAMSVATCACGPDMACLGALDRLNHKCRKCNQEWVVTCMEVACKAQSEANSACMRARGCSSVTSCGDCAATAAALSTCVLEAQNDPRDIGGCYWGPRHCSGELLCSFIPF